MQRPNQPTASKPVKTAASHAVRKEKLAHALRRNLQRRKQGNTKK